MVVPWLLAVDSAESVYLLLSAALLQQVVVVPQCSVLLVVSWLVKS